MSQGTRNDRSTFCRISLWLDRSGLKNVYLNVLHGERREDRYENHPPQYRSNTSEVVAELGHAFRQVEAINFSVGQWDPYFLAFVRPLVPQLDRWAIRRGKPGMLLAIRARE
jgi:hypothetical protein